MPSSARAVNVPAESRDTNAKAQWVNLIILKFDY